jgi:hypothetical protein
MTLSTGQDVCVGGIDVGSPKSGNLGWAIRKGEQKSHGDDLAEFIMEFAKLRDGCPAALGFEAPLFVPIRDKALELHRTTLANRSFCLAQLQLARLFSRLHYRL